MTNRNRDKGKFLPNHGMSGTPTYETYRAMRKRCENTSDKEYSRYGGLGIAVCDNWKTFEGFYLDMGVRPKGSTLDRRDNSKGYYKENCRWATHKEQANNRTNNVYLLVDGEKRSIKEWSSISGIAYQTIQRRVKTYGWNHKDAVFKPSRVMRKKRVD